ncbi:CD9 antigen, partial [Rhizoclosmatium sp. JEL0117]
MTVKIKAAEFEDVPVKYKAPIVVGEATDPISFVTISWLSKMIWAGGKRPLQYEDLPLIPERSQADAVAHILDRFNDNVDKFLKSGSPQDKTPRLFPDIWKFLGVSYMFAVFLDCVHVVFQTTQPAVMGAIISYLQNGESNIFLKSPIGLALLYFSMTFLGLIFRQTTQQMFRRMTFGIRSTIVTALYAKSLKLSNKANAEFSKGRILQMINSDVEEISLAVQNTHAVVMVPFQLAFSFYYLANLFGTNLYPVGIVTGISLSMAPGLIYLFTSQQGKYQKAGDKRLATLREVFEGIKMVKLRGQEKFFIKILTDARNTQLSAIAALAFGMFFFMNLATL